jgi:hypothetical protein
VQLADNIRRGHQEVVGAVSHAAVFAIRTGEYLIEAKALLRHGQFGDFITLECGLKRSTADVYMKLARNKDQCSQLLTANSQSTRNLTQAQMLRFLSSATKSRKPKGKRGKGNGPQRASPRSWWRLGLF